MGEHIVHYIKLPLTVRAFTTIDCDGNFVIAINSALTYEMQLMAYEHELMHICNGDLDSIINVDAMEKILH